jgi:hypothetical protein
LGRAERGPFVFLAAEKLCIMLWKNGQKTRRMCVDGEPGIAENPCGMLFYLAGSIEYSPDLGKSWRARDHVQRARVLLRIIVVQGLSRPECLLSSRHPALPS